MSSRGNNDKQLAFLNELLEQIIAGKGNPQEIYPFFERNINQFNESFIQTINNWTNIFLSKQSGETAQLFAGLIWALGNLIYQFTLGNHAINLEIAITCYQAALQVYQPDQFPQEWSGAQKNLALVYINRIKGDKAENIEKAITFFENALQISTKEALPQDWARIQYQLARAYSERINGNKAKNIETAISACEKALQIFTKEALPQDWAMTQNGLGIVYKERINGNKADNLERAIAYYKNALEIYTFDTFPVEWARTKHNLANAYCDRIDGDQAENLEKAITLYHEALQVRTKEALPQDWAETQNNLATAYIDRINGDPAKNIKKAIVSFENALQIRTKEALPFDWAITQLDLGIAYSQRIKEEKAENLEKAIAFFENALQIFTKDTFPLYWGITQLNLANAYGDRIKRDKADNIEKAISAGEKALQIFTKDTFPLYWSMSQNNLGLLYSERINEEQADNVKQAIKYYRNSLQFQTPDNFPLECLRSSRNLGNLAFKEENWNLAIEGYTNAIKAVENSRSEAISEIRSQEIMAQVIEVYHNIVQSYINLGQIDKAIEYVEQSKTRDLVKLLANRDLYPKGNIPQTVIKELDRLRKQIVTEEKQLATQEMSINRAMMMGEGRQQQNQSQIPNRSKINQLKQELDNLIKDQITSKDPNFSLTQKVETISFDEIKNLTDKNTAIIQWYITEDKILTFIVTADSQQPIIQQFPSEDLKALIEEINNYLNLYLTSNEEWQNQLEFILEKFAQYLHLDKIISNVPQECNSLILILHRFIHLLPIHSFPIDNIPLFDTPLVPLKKANAKCLLDLFPNGIKYAPSCQLLQLVQKQKRDNFNNLFAIQNPTNDLQYTNIEVDTIRQLFKPNDKILVRDNATKENITQQNLNQTNYSHFSSHGYFNFQEPLKSALILANSYTQKQENVKINSEKFTRSPQDETIDLEKCLTLGDIFNLDLRNCSLVTLSACETGLTDVNNISDEYISLPSGFFFAGSTNVVSSLWAVNDLSTAFLMIKFYHNHKQENLPVVKALNEAQKWLRELNKKELNQWIQDKQIPLDPTLKMNLKRSLRNLSDDDRPFQKPYYWGAFCAIGK